MAAREEVCSLAPGPLRQFADVTLQQKAAFMAMRCICRDGLLVCDTGFEIFAGLRPSTCWSQVIIQPLVA